MAATEMAMKESGLPVGPDKPHGYVPEKVGVIIGSGIGGLGSLEEQHKKAEAGRQNAGEAEQGHNLR